MATNERLVLEIADSGFQAAFENEPDAKGFKIKLDKAIAIDKDGKEYGPFELHGQQVNKKQITILLRIDNQHENYAIRKIQLFDAYSGKLFGEVYRTDDQIIDYVNPAKVTQIMINLVIGNLEDGTVTVVDYTGTMAEFNALLDGHVHASAAHPWSAITDKPAWLANMDNSKPVIDSANRLSNPRYIGGVAFDGSANVHLPVSAGYVATQMYQPGDLVKLDGHWYECYHPDGCKGKDPRDKKNRPSGWTETDESKPYYWLEVGVNSALSLPEIGSPIYLPTTSLREGLIKYRGDANLHIAKFWRLAKRYYNLIKGDYIQVADLRGEFLRGWDDQRGVDSSRVVNSSQGDAIRNLVGKITLLATSGYYLDTIVSASGIFSKSIEYEDGDNHYQIRGDVPGSYVADINCNISNQVPTASENRPRNIAMMIATRF